MLAQVPGATIIADVKASRALFDRVAELGGKPLMWKTGHSLIKSKMKETGAPLAGEMSGHVFFAHEYYGFDDALYAGVRLIAASARLGKSVTELRSAMPAMINTPEMRFQVDESRKFAVIDEVKQRLVGQRRARSTRPTACASPRPTAGGCCAPRTRRTCWSPARKATAKRASNACCAQIDEQLAASGLERGPQAGH